MWLLVVFLLGSGLPAQTSKAPRRRQADSLEARVQLAMARAPGSVSFFAKNLDSGKSYGVRSEERVRTASTIKVPIMIALFGEAAAGRLRFSDEVELRKEDKVGGSGLLKELSDGVKLPLKDLLHFMIIVSDNTATNLLLDRVTADTVNRYMGELGFPHTLVLRKILGPRNQPEGLAETGKLEQNKRYGIGVTTPRELVLLLERIERGEIISPEASKEMIAILKRQFYTDGIGRRLAGTPFASKSGALDALRSDAGIVYSKRGRIALSITVDGIQKSDWSADNPGHLFISELTGILLEGLGR